MVFAFAGDSTITNFMNALILICKALYHKNILRCQGFYQKPFLLLDIVMVYVVVLDQYLLALYILQRKWMLMKIKLMITIKCSIGYHGPSSLNIKVANQGVLDEIHIDPIA